jgi:hypothetical protein
MRVAVQTGRLAVCRPSGVCNSSMRIKCFGEIGLGFLDKLLQLSNLAYFFVRKDLVFPVPIDRDARRIISTVFETGQTCTASQVSASTCV